MGPLLQESEDDLNFLYKHFGTEGDDLRYFHIPEFRAHKALMLWVPPILLLLGTLGNTCSFAVLRQKTMRQQSIYMYLCALAVFDSLVLYVGLLRLWLGEITGTDIRNMSPWVCKSTLMLGYTCSDVSVWLIVAVTVERYIVVCHPLRARAFCQQLRAKIIIAGTVLVFSFVNIHFLFSTSLVENLNIASEALPPESQDGETMTCGPLPGYGFLVNVVWPWVDAMLYGLGPFLFISVLNTVIIFKALPPESQDGETMTCGPLPGYGFLVNVVWPWVDAMLYGLGPFLFISVLNTVIIFKIFRANSSRAALTNRATNKSKKQLQRGPGGSDTSELRFSSAGLSLFVESSDNFSPALLKAQKFSPAAAVGITRSAPTKDVTAGSLRMTVMLLSVSFTFMLTTLPMTVSNIIANTVINTSRRTDRTMAQGLLVHTLALLLMYLNHSVNFLLYCVTGRKFRKVITRMYSGKMCAVIQRRSTESNPLDHSDHLYCSRGNISR
ncbi:hypothetical protein RRG08_026189 [Elysia crispata]|uniref:G-protein coupled receptors family 1 profile domain-containing protein n=1 Tax=Elysia crispata TaxID=231223 RepID=A0AAE0ZBN8_9GAST|nr:hypothetical protein RRG08_026189 [Elysia crispata]